MWTSWSYALTKPLSDSRIERAPMRRADCSDRDPPSGKPRNRLQSFQVWSADQIQGSHSLSGHPEMRRSTAWQSVGFSRGIFTGVRNRRRPFSSGSPSLHRVPRHADHSLQPVHPSFSHWAASWGVGPLFATYWKAALSLFPRPRKSDPTTGCGSIGTRSSPRGR